MRYYSIRKKLWDRDVRTCKGIAMKKREFPEETIVPTEWETTKKMLAENKKIEMNFPWDMNYVYGTELRRVAYDESDAYRIQGPNRW